MLHFRRFRVFGLDVHLLRGKHRLWCHDGHWSFPDLPLEELKELEHQVPILLCSGFLNGVPGYEGRSGPTKGLGLFGHFVFPAGQDLPLVPRVQPASRWERANHAVTSALPPSYIEQECDATDSGRRFGLPVQPYLAIMTTACSIFGPCEVEWWRTNIKKH